MSENYNTNEVSSTNDYVAATLPTGLNVLTILTIIWCVITLGISGFSFYSAKSSFDKKDEVLAQMNRPDMPAFAKTMMGKPADFETMVVKSYENRIPILILSVVGSALCLIGALQMRKRKKQGYLLYVIGEIMPFITLAFFIGLFAITGIMSIFSIVIAGLFILLYTMQRKHLVY